MSDYVKMGANVVCTYMTKPVPVKVGPSVKSCPTIIGQDKPMLRVVDCKLSDCLNCRVPQMHWNGLVAYLAAIAIVACVIAAVVLTGGAAAVAVGAVLLGATTTTVTTVATISAVVTTAGFLGVSIYGACKLGYELEHLCDESLGSRWQLQHDGTIIEKEKAILDRSLLNCPQGGLLSIITDETLALQAAQMISGNNQNVISLELENQIIQGLVSGLTGGANPISFAIDLGCKLLGGTFGKVIGNTCQVVGTLKDGKGVKESYQGAKNAIAVVEQGKKTAEGAVKGAERAASEAVKRKSSAETAKVVSQKQAASLQRGVKAATKKADKLATDAEKAAVNAEKTMEKASRAKTDLKIGITSFALGIGGFLLNEFLIDKRFGKEEQKISDRTNDTFLEMLNNNTNNSNVISNE